MRRVRHFEAVAVRLSDGAECVLGEFTTARAALNSLAFRAAFGPAGVVYRVRDNRSGVWVASLTG